ncbi:MAG: sodium:proton exchanger, partial [Epsilonproteobacteria bacterium]|nr:sodium:proton exchanger [Campylobacterota bacterium]
MDDRSGSTQVQSKSMQFIENYWDLIGGILLAILAFITHQQHNVYLTALFAATAIGFLSITVSEIAEILAERLGEPLGSYVLTITAVTVEIVLLFNVLLESSHNPSALDTVKGGIISAVIVDMNVLLGLAVFVGGLAFREQQHNEDTSSTYTTILYVSALALLVPSILKNTNHTTDILEEVSLIIGALLFGFYIVILIFQTKTHTHFFKATARSRIFRFKRQLDEEEEHDDYIFDKFPNYGNFLVIFALIFVIGILAELFAHDGLWIAKEHGISTG